MEQGLTGPFSLIENFLRSAEDKCLRKSTMILFGCSLGYIMY